MLTFALHFTNLFKINAFRETAGCGSEAEQRCGTQGPLSQLPTNLPTSAATCSPLISKLASAPIKNDALSPATTASASRCLYLQGVRALIKYVPQHFQKDHVEVVVDRLLLYSKCASSYEQVHTAERALENMAEAVDPLHFMRAILVTSKHVPVWNGEDGKDGTTSTEIIASASSDVDYQGKTSGRRYSV